jgi:hypothetical protein
VDKLPRRHRLLLKAPQCSVDKSLRRHRRLLKDLQFSMDQPNRSLLPVRMVRPKRMIHTRGNIMKETHRMEVAPKTGGIENNRLTFFDGKITSRCNRESIKAPCFHRDLSRKLRRISCLKNRADLYEIQIIG